jgi:hypothetical protein
VKAKDWPVVGSLATRFREAYLGGEKTNEPTAEAIQLEQRVTETERRHQVALVSPPKPPPEQLQAPVKEVPATVEEEQQRREIQPVLSRSVAKYSLPSPKPQLQYIAKDWAWFLPGVPILASPAPNGEQKTSLGTLAYLPILSRDGQWAEVLYQDQRSWVDILWEPPHSRRQARRGIARHQSEPVLDSDRSKIYKARKMLGIKRSKEKIGAYKLFTDVEDEDLLAFLDGAAIAAEDAYFARYGRLPSGNPFRSAVLFAAEADYRLYSEKTAPSVSNVGSGHAGSGVLAFYAEGRSRVSLACTLVHEIAHLLNERSIAWSLPTWLEEGIASDLGSLWVESSVSVGSAPRLGRRQALEIQGFEARLLYLGKALDSGQLPPLRFMFSLDRETFYRPDIEEYSYAQSAAFIRYLLDGEEGRLADGFRSFLKRVSSGRSANLLKSLETDIRELDDGYRIWLRQETQVIRKRLKDKAERLR